MSETYSLTAACPPSVLVSPGEDVSADWTQNPLEATRESGLVAPAPHGTLSADEQASLEALAHDHGLAPENYNVNDRRASVLWTPCRTGALNVHVDGRFWHMPGGVIGPRQLQPRVIRWLTQIADRQRVTTAVYSVGPEEADWYREAGFRVNKFGEEPIVDLEDLDWRGGAFEWVRRQTNFCLRHGLECVEVDRPESSAELVEQLRTIHAADLSDRVYSKPLHLLESEFDPERLLRRRLFLARERDSHRIEAFLIASPSHGGRTWSFDCYRKRPGSPRGAMPFLFRQVIDRLKGEGAEHVSLCLVPGRGSEHDRGANMDPWVRWVLKTWYHRLNLLFNAAGQDYFKSRFRPRYVDRYICVYPCNSLASVLSFMRSTGALTPNFTNLIRRSLRGSRHK